MRSSLLVFLQYISLFAFNGNIDQFPTNDERDRTSFDQYIIGQISRLIPTRVLSDEFSTFQPTKCGTHILNSLVKNSSLLSSSSKIELSQLGIDFNRDIPGFSRPAGLDDSFDSGIFRFHYTTAGHNAVDDTDSNMDGVPDYINLMAIAYERAFEVESTIYGFIRPPSDDWYSDDNGGSNAYDIYIFELESSLYGYTQMEYFAQDHSGDNEFSNTKEKNATTSYIAMRNSYEGFPFSDEESIQVTAAHELFHAIQFGYDGWDAIWMLEATATWMEDEVFDHINDNYQYFQKWLEEPHLALNLDRTPHWYGSWIFFRYLSEHIGGYSTIRKIFERSIVHDSQNTDLSIRTIDEALRSVGSNFSDALSSMVIANQVLSSNPSAGEYTYEEADAYRDSGITPHLNRSVVLTDTEYTIIHEGGQLMHNASHYIDLTAASGPLEISFTPMNTSSRFRVNGIIQETSGIVSIYEVDVNAIISIPYSAESVVIAVVTDTTEDAIYDYSMELNPEVPLPSSITLYQNFPNPFNTTTTLRFFLPQFEPVSLKIFDLKGRQVGIVNLPKIQQGYNDATFEARYLPSGVYIAKLEGETEYFAKKLTLVK